MRRPGAGRAGTYWRGSKANAGALHRRFRHGQGGMKMKPRMAGGAIPRRRTTGRFMAAGVQQDLPPKRRRAARSRRASSGAQSGQSGAAKSRVASVPCQAPSPNRMAQSNPSPARSTRLLLVSSRRSTKGCAARNSAAVAAASRSRRCRRRQASGPPQPPAAERSSVPAMRRKASVRPAAAASPSSVRASPRGRRRNRAPPRFSQGSSPAWLTAAWVTRSRSRPGEAELTGRCLEGAQGIQGEMRPGHGEP